MNKYLALSLLCSMQGSYAMQEVDRLVLKVHLAEKGTVHARRQAYESPTAYAVVECELRSLNEADNTLISSRNELRKYVLTNYGPAANIQKITQKTNLLYYGGVTMKDQGVFLHTTFDKNDLNELLQYTSKAEDAVK